MNNEIIKSLTGREYIMAFINKDIRVDRRNLQEKRKAIYQFGILDSFSTSASCLLGTGTKVIAVIKSHNAPISDSESNFLSGNTNKILDLHVENLSESPLSSSSGKLTSSYSEPNLLHFINKLIEDNLELEIPVPLRFSLHISIINSDGNIYDCISHLISNLFSGKLTKENECGLNRYLKLKRNFISNTFCIIEDKLILDPTAEEVNYSTYYFSVVNFYDGKQGEYIIHKIKGDSINFGLLEEAMLLTKH
jgi:exosome complex RNA-binding protein Rrp42 (RNase PH superfamily)